MNIPVTDQWLLDGDCDKCRRQNYCGKECKKSRLVTQQVIQSMILKKMAEAAAKYNEPIVFDKAVGEASDDPEAEVTT